MSLSLRPRDVAPAGSNGGSVGPSAAPTPAHTPKAAFVLSDLNLHFPKDRLSLICGKLGSGKSLLLQGLLGEADLLAGQIICPRSAPNGMSDYGATIKEEDWIVPGTTAYASQVAWLMNATIKDNVLMGTPFVAQRYEDVLVACSLKSDLAIMDDGDETSVGDKGITLSGGQKARVTLARAIYSRAQLILL